MRSFVRGALVLAILYGFTSVGRSGDPKATEPKLDIAPKPGYAIGRVVMPNGKAIPLKGIKYHINITGKNDLGIFESIPAMPDVDADGNYEQKLHPDYVYRYESVYMDVTFNEQRFQLELWPIGDDKTYRPGAKGIVQNYVWKLQGAKPLRDGQAKPNADRYTDWYGATVQMLYVYPGFPPKDFHKCTFTLTPKGKLIDGSDGKTTTFTRNYDDLLGELKGGGSLTDLPLGNYTVKGVEEDKAGNKKPLLFETADKKFVESVEIGFVPYPAPNIGIDPKPLRFKRQGEK